MDPVQDDFYSISEIAELLDYNIIELLKLGAEGKLEFKVFITGDIEEGYSVDEDPEDPNISRMPSKKYHVNNMLMSVRENDLINLYKTIVSTDAISNEVRVQISMLQDEEESGRYIKLGQDETISASDLFVSNDELIRLQKTQTDKNNFTSDFNEAPYLNIKHDFYSQELKIAVEVWMTLYKNGPSTTPHGGHKKYISEWLDENYPRLSGLAKGRINTLVNPRKQGGAPKTEK